MNCPNCGTSNLDNASICVNCGRSLSASAASHTPPPPPPSSFGSAPPQQGPAIPNYLVQSILVTFCCCLPLGIAAIVFAAQVNSKLAQGDILGARESSRKAKMFCWIALGVGIVAWIFCTIFYGALIANVLHQAQLQNR